MRDADRASEQAHARTIERGMPTGWARPGCRSDTQTLAALGAAGVEHGATTASLHAHEEAVRACAADFGGLIGAFHDGLGLWGLVVAAKAGSGKRLSVVWTRSAGLAALWPVTLL